MEMLVFESQRRNPKHTCFATHAVVKLVVPQAATLTSVFKRELTNAAPLEGPCLMTHHFEDRKR